MVYELVGCGELVAEADVARVELVVRVLACFNAGAEILQVVACCKVLFVRHAVCETGADVVAVYDNVSWWICGGCTCMQKRGRFCDRVHVRALLYN